MKELLIILVIFGYVLIQIIEITSMGSRVAGKLSGSLALGTTLHLSIYTGSRFLLILFLPALAFLVESGINVDDYFIVVFTCLFTTFFASLFIVIKFNIFQNYFQKVFSLYQNNLLPLALLKSLNYKKNKNISIININILSIKKINKRKAFTSFLAYLFLANGFFISFLLAINFPEYRLTLSQFVPAIHGVGALIVAFYLDPMLSNSIDRNINSNIWLNNVFSILYGRVLSYIFVSLIFLIFYLY
jgi:hypothetical protein